MPLQGTFDVLDFSAVLEILSARSMTGRLHVRSRSFAANLFFVDGQIVGADQSEHQAAAVSGDVPQRAQEVCFELLGTDRGNFEFHPGKPSGPRGWDRYIGERCPRRSPPAAGRMAGTSVAHPVPRRAAAPGDGAGPGASDARPRAMAGPDGRGRAQEPALDRQGLQYERLRRLSGHARPAVGQGRRTGYEAGRNGLDQ